jgi:epoxyqueuosine reductase
MNPGPFKRHLKRAGATLVGVGDVTDALPPDIGYLRRAVSIAVNKGLNADTVSVLIGLQKEAEKWLKGRGYRFLCIPPDSDRRKGKFVSRLYELFSHKTAATCSGLGWVGKSGLIINKDYGPRLSWATVLTDAPFEPDRPVQGSRCGDCDYCVRHCPSGAISGRLWSVEEPFRELVRYEQCRSLKTARQGFEGKPNCGLCITICPYARQDRGKNTGKEDMREARG